MRRTRSRSPRRVQSRSPRKVVRSRSPRRVQSRSPRKVQNRSPRKVSPRRSPRRIQTRKVVRSRSPRKVAPRRSPRKTVGDEPKVRANFVSDIFFGRNRKRSPRKVVGLKNRPKPNYKRPSPPYPAKYSPGEIIKGNHGKLYRSRIISNGTYRWFLYNQMFAPKVTSPRSRTKSSRREMMVKDTPLSDQKQKWCRCVLHVAAKQGRKCLREKRWGQVVDGEKCYNPMKVCSSTVKTSARSCDLWYNIDSLTKDELLGMANLKKLDVNSRDSKEKIKKVINVDRASKYDSFA